MNRFIAVVINEVAEIRCVKYAVFELKCQFGVQLGIEVVDVDATEISYNLHNYLNDNLEKLFSSASEDILFELDEHFAVDMEAVAKRRFIYVDIDFITKGHNKVF
jgi:hypothetical protein